MDVVAGPFAIVAVVLAVGGALKVWSPASTTEAVAGSGLAVGRFDDLGSRLLGLGELVGGAAALAYGGRLLAGGVALAYLGFAAFVERARRRGQASCGCFGRTDTPPTRLHTAVNLGSAAAAGIAAITGVAALDATLRDQPMAGLPFVGLVLVGAAGVYVAMTMLPGVLRPPATSRPGTFSVDLPPAAP